MLLAACIGIFFGLGCAAVTFVVAGLHFAAKGEPELEAQPGTSRARNRGGGLALVGILGFVVVLYLVGTSLPTKTTQERPKSGAAAQASANS